MAFIYNFFGKQFWNKVSIGDVKAGDHIYSWRTVVKAYAHHGIYVGNDEVIHYTNFGSKNNNCRKCGDQSKQSGVLLSCVDCFLDGGSLYLFVYSASMAGFIARPDGTCTTAPTDPSDKVIYRARYLLEKNGFGAYNVLENNCEDFAVYCKTTLVSGPNYLLGRSGQANQASISRWLGNFNVFGTSASRLTADVGRAAGTKVSVEDLVVARRK